MRHSEFPIFGIKGIASTILVLASMASIVLGTRAGIIPIGHLQKFWPLALVAIGLFELISWPERKDS